MRLGTLLLSIPPESRGEFYSSPVPLELVRWVGKCIPYILKGDLAEQPKTGYLMETPIHNFWEAVTFNRIPNSRGYAVERCRWRRGGRGEIGCVVRW